MVVMVAMAGLAGIGSGADLYQEFQLSLRLMSVASVSLTPLKQGLVLSEFRNTAATLGLASKAITRAVGPAV